MNAHTAQQMVKEQQQKALELLATDLSNTNEFKNITIQEPLGLRFNKRVSKHAIHQVQLGKLEVHTGSITQTRDQWNINAELVMQVTDGVETTETSYDIPYIMRNDKDIGGEYLNQVLDAGKKLIYR